MSERVEEAVWIPSAGQVGLGQTADALPAAPAPPAAPIVVAPSPVAPVVVAPSVSFGAALFIALGAALIGGVAVWMWVGQPELVSVVRENPKPRKRRKTTKRKK